MSIFEIIIISIGLTMDAFAVSICKGLSMKKLNYKKIMIIALYFGLFQAFMPVIGYFLGSKFSLIVEKVDHWIVFILLSILGVIIGNKFGDKFQNKAELFGGIILIIIGLKILLEHLRILYKNIIKEEL